jgi:hypothetical protein
MYGLGAVFVVICDGSVPVVISLDSAFLLPIHLSSWSVMVCAHHPSFLMSCAHFPLVSYGVCPFPLHCNGRISL